jgi:hypothetical protein
MYFAEDYNASSPTILPNYISNGRNATLSGTTVTKSTASGNGATAPITFISGTTGSIITFPSGSIPDTFTILSLTRYTTTGTKIGTATTQKLAFWNATPIVQPTASTAIDTLLTNTGLRASGGGANFDTPITASIISASAFIGNLSGSATSASYATTSSYATNFVVEGTLVINETLTDSATINSSIVGSNNLFTQATGSYTSAFGKYTISNGSNARAGEFMTVWNGTTTTYTDTSTTDIGNTADITFTSAIVSSNIQIDAVAASSGWTIKMLTTFI